MNLTVDNLKASISKKANIPANEFKLRINRQTPTGVTKLKDLQITKDTIVEIKFQMKGGGKTSTEHKPDKENTN